MQNKVPAVIMLHGFSVDRNELLFSHKILADKLCEQGIASFRFDFMGSGESDGEFKNASVLTEVMDAETILDYVVKLEYVNTEKIAVHGANHDYGTQEYNEKRMEGAISFFQKQLL